VPTTMIAKEGTVGMMFIPFFCFLCSSSSKIHVYYNIQCIRPCFRPSLYLYR
jgi:hypothetical protein